MPFDLDDDSALGTLLEGRWRLVRRLGRGGMGQVFQVVHARMGIVRCVKILRPGAEEILLKRFEREVRLAQQIRHPNVIRIDDFGVDATLHPEGLHYYVMEYAEGESLRDIVARGELPVARAASLCRQVALGVAAAHASAIIHRDIKPENVVVSAGDHVTVLDFGIAKARAPDAREDMATLTRKGEIWATPQYMSPEQAMAATDLTPSSDIYSLGVVLHELLCGELPFSAATAQEFIFAHLQRAVTPLRKRRPELRIPPALDDLVLSMLEKQPARRPASMEAVARALEAFAGSAAGAASATVPPPPPPPPPAPPPPPPPPPPPAPPPQTPPRGRPADPGPSAPAAPRSTPSGAAVAPDATVDLPPRAAPVAAAPVAPRVVVFPHGPRERSAAAGAGPRRFPVLAKVFVHLGEELHEHVVGRSRLTLGRHADNDIVVADRLASKTHAALLLEGERAWIEDLHSRNGTFLGKTRVEGRVSLAPVEAIRIGNTRLLFCRGDARVGDHFRFCARGHPGDPGARFCGACGSPLG